MKKEIIKNIISEWLEEFIFPNIKPRDDVPSGKELKNLAEIFAIVGPRRAGKTFAMYQIINSLIEQKIAKRDDIIFLDFEDYRLSDFVPNDIEDLLSIFRQLTGKNPVWLFFDEVHKMPEWSKVLRTLHNKRAYRIIISGSNARLLIPEIASELRGRYRDHLVLPLSFKELLKWNNISWSERIFYTTRRGDLLRVFDEYMKFGGFPEVIKYKSLLERRQLIQNYYRTIFYHDILDRYRIKAKHLIEAMMSFCLYQSASLFSISSFEKALKLDGRSGSKRTLANYLVYLKEAFFIITSEKFSYSVRQRIMNPKKIYLIDPAFVLLSESFSENKSRILENIVAIELFRKMYSIYYYKEYKERDFVIKDKITGDFKVIQVCWSLNVDNKKREINGIFYAMKKLSLSSGFILTYDDREESIDRDGKKIHIIPVWKWLLNED